MLINLLVAVVLGYCVLCAALFLLQRSLLYFPTPDTNRRGASVIALPGLAERILVSTQPSAGPDALLYFGGNAEDVAFNMPDLRAAFPRHALYLLHYRGYGGSAGSPSETALVADALILYEHVRAAHPSIVLIGRSLGSGIAVRVASLRPVARLILVTPFDSIQDIATRAFPYLPVRLLLLDKYESWRYAPQVTAPTLIVAAEHDEVIPRASTELLRMRFRKDLVQYAVVPGAGHNNIDYLPLLKNDR